MNDLKYAFRQLLKHPGFTAVAVLTLALGIGATTTVFSVLDPLILQPVPGPYANRVVGVSEFDSAQSEHRGVSPPVLRQLREATHLLDSVASYDRYQGQLSDDVPERLVGSRVSANLFGLLGASSLLGRGFSEEDEQVGAPPVVMLSHGLWQRRFGGAPDVIGRTIRLNNEATTIVGIMPSSFQFPNRGWLCEFWMPERIPRFELFEPHVRHQRNLGVLARLAPSVSLSQAQAGVVLLAQRNAEQFPETSEGWHLRLQPAKDVFSDEKLRGTLWTLFGVTIFVLLICCANVSNLQLGRAESRAREMAIRLTLGSTRGRLLRLVLMESLLLALLGCALGLPLSVWGEELFAVFGDVSLPQLRDVRLNGLAMGFALGLAVVCSVGFGLFSAWASTGFSPEGALQRHILGTRDDGRSFRWQRGLILLETALAMSLVMGALLMLRSLTNVAFTDSGFDTRHLARFGVYFENEKNAVNPSRNNLTELVRRIESLPGVASVGVVTEEGEREIATEDHQSRRVRFVSASVEPNDLTKTLGMRLRRGRPLADGDQGGGVREILVNESLARSFWPGENPLGRLLRPQQPDGRPMPGEVFLVTGVVEDLRRNLVEGTLDERPDPTFYVAAERAATPDHAWVYLRSGGNVQALEKPIGQEIRALAGARPTRKLESIEQLIADADAPRSEYARLLTVFAGMGLLVAMIGVGGVTAFWTAWRTREIGIRMALGAQGGDVLAWVLRQCLTPAVVGIGLGTLGGILLSQLIRHWLVGVSPQDPATLASVAALMVVVTLCACWLPARRAARLDPMVALRSE